MIKSYKNLLKSLLIFVLVMSIFLFSAFLEYQREVDKEKRVLDEELTRIKITLENLINAKINVAYGLRTYVEVNKSLDQEIFDSFSNNILDVGQELIRSLAFLTDTRISHVYPYEENQSAIGVDLSLVEGQRDWVLYVKENIVTVLSAPVNLVQGGRGIIVRVPIAVKEEYIGQISIVFDYMKTLESSGTIKLSEDHVLSLRVYDFLKQDYSDVWTNRIGPYAYDNEDERKVSLEIYDVHLSLTASPKDGYFSGTPLFYWIIAMGILVASTVSYMMTKLITTKERLQRNQVALKGSKDSLITLNQNLEKTVEQLKASESYNAYLAEHDPLTNLFNRRKFTSDISKALEEGKKGSILLIDIDDFKLINDSRGHIYGDQVLKNIGDVLINFEYKESTAYRIGGDEFVIHLRDVSNEEHIEKSISTFFNQIKNCHEKGGKTSHLTSSVGISKYPDQGQSVNELLMKADIAMYEAKKNGKNQFAYFTKEMTSPIDWKIKVESLLRDALENDGFYLVYQPVIESKSLNIAYYEALIRVEDATMTPNVFIPIAEESSLIIGIGRWVISQVFLHLQAMKNQGFDLKPIAINLSPKQINDQGLIDFLKDALVTYQIPVSYVEFEITENVLIENDQESIRVLNEIRSLGFKIALDDFGTGYSSLSYLTYMPVDKVKIDKSLKDRFIYLEHVKVMENLIALCHGLQMQVVTEGVETLEEFSQLKIKGSDFVQGYLFSKPVKGHEMIKFQTNQYVNFMNQ